MAIFGHYLTPEGLQKIKNYQYRCGQYTFLDNTMNHFWNFCVEFVPMWFAPNVLTLLGFLSSWIAFITAMIYTPNFSEATPAIPCVIIALSVFMYQTLDAIDGKQARRTGTSSPLGTLFDHGCDIVTGTILALTVVALCRTGASFWTFVAVTVSSQLMQFLYLWWEYHFHVFFSNPGYGTGVTEAQIGIMIFALLTGFYGADIWIMNVLTFLPESIHSLITSITTIQSLQLSHLVMVVIIINNAAAALYIMVSGLSKLSSEKRYKGFLQIASFFGFLSVEWFFYQSTILRLGIWSPLAFFTITLAYSTICLRILLSSTSERYYHSFQWPATPFTVIALLMYFSPYVSSGLAAWVDANCLWLIIADACWQLIYLSDLVITSIDDMCQTLDVQCFVIPPIEQEKKKSK